MLRFCHLTFSFVLLICFNQILIDVTCWNSTCDCRARKQVPAYVFMPQVIPRDSYRLGCWISLTLEDILTPIVETSNILQLILSCRKSWALKLKNLGFHMFPGLLITCILLRKKLKVKWYFTYFWISYWK